MKHYGFKFMAGLFVFLLSALLQVKEVQAADNPLLKFVPADTLFFSGNSHLINFSDYPLVTFNQSIEVPLSQSERQTLGKEASFFYELFLDFEATVLSTPTNKSLEQQGFSALQSHYGLSEIFAAAFYTVGVTPVLKFTLDNEKAFLDVLDKAAQKSGFQYSMERFANLSYRAYPISEKLQLLVYIQASNDGQKLATLSLLSNTLDDEQKKLIFGISKPQQSIAQTGKLTAIQKNNQYLPISVSFLDFQVLVKTFFQVENNPWVELLGDDEQIFVDLQASGCATDVMAIAQEMPQLIAGYKHYQVQGQRITMVFEALLKLKNHNVKTELNKFRGFIPQYIHQGAKDNILAFGLGINLSQITPMLAYISKAFRETTFHCEWFKNRQKDVAGYNPAMLALAAGVVDGVKGISFALQDFNLNHQAKKENKLDAKLITDDHSLSMLMSLSAEEPLRVWQMMSAFVPSFTQSGTLIVPSDKPQKLTFPELGSAGFDVFVALKGEHLVLFRGKKAAAISHTLVKEKIVSNGFFHKTLNYTKLTSAVADLRDYLASPSNPEPLPAEACIYFDESIALLSRFSGFVDFHSDFVTNGWLNVINVDINLRNQNNIDYQLPGKYETYNVEDNCQLVKEGLEEIHADGSGFYQQHSENGECFIFETRYRWLQKGGQLELQYVSERSRPEGVCVNAFDDWSVPKAEYVKDVCQLRVQADSNFACLFNWDGSLNKSVYKRL